MDRKSTYPHRNNGSVSRRTEPITRPKPYSLSKLKPMYLELPLSEDQLKLMRRCFKAMANLYGIISLREAFDIVGTHMEGAPSDIDFPAFANIARHEKSFCIMGESERGYLGLADIDDEVNDFFRKDSDAFPGQSALVVESRICASSSQRAPLEGASFAHSPDKIWSRLPPLGRKRGPGYRSAYRHDQRFS